MDKMEETQRDSNTKKTDNMKEIYGRLKGISSKMTDDEDLLTSLRKKSTMKQGKTGFRDKDVTEITTGLQETQGNLSEVKEVIAKTKEDMETGITDVKNNIANVQHAMVETRDCLKTDLSDIKRQSLQITEVQKDLKTDISDVKRQNGVMAKSQKDIEKEMQDMKMIIREMYQQNKELSKQIRDQNSTLSRRALYTSSSTLDTGFSEATSCELLPLAEEDPEDPVRDSVRAHGKIPADVFDYCQRMETLIYDRVIPLSRQLGIDHERLTDLRDELDYRGDYANLFWLVIHKWCENCIAQSKHISLDSLQYAIQQCGIVGPRSIVKPMPPLDGVIVETSVSILVEYLIVHQLIVEIRSTGLLYPAVVKYVLEPKNQVEKVTRLVDILAILGDKAVDTLITALEQSSQGHIADMITSKYPERFGVSEKKHWMKNPIKWIGKKLARK